MSDKFYYYLTQIISKDDFKYRVYFSESAVTILPSSSIENIRTLFKIEIAGLTEPVDFSYIVTSTENPRYIDYSI